MDHKLYKKIAFLFPGQGAQSIGMASDFVHAFSAARLTFEEADELLKRPLSSIILNGPEEKLTQTKNSQTAIYVASMAILRVVKELFDFQPFVCAGLSLGEYTALTAADWMNFRNALPLVQYRGEFMNEACETTPGAMAVIMGMSNEAVEELVAKLNLPNEVWIANYNCPGQIVLSGTLKGIEAATLEAKAMGAKRALPLAVHGAFHSGLMQQAEERLAPYIQQVPIKKGPVSIVMNVPGDFVSDPQRVLQYMTQQVTHSVRWEQGIRAMEKEGVDLFIEFGPGKTLSGMNKRIGVQAPTLSIEKIEDLEQIEKLVMGGKIG
ncbi:MAG: ACP S-malonyltransferase [Chlamydiales bacterium]